MFAILTNLKRLRRFLESPTVVLKTRTTLKQINEFLNPPENGTLILNLGSGSTFYGPHVINMNIFQWPHVNVVGDAHKLPFRSDSLDAVFCQAVLEHVPQPAVVVAEIQRVLKPGGKVYVDYSRVSQINKPQKVHKRTKSVGFPGTPRSRTTLPYF